MILSKSFNKNSRKFSFCSCNNCCSFFVRRDDYSNFDLCYRCSNMKSALARQTHGCSNANSRLHVTWSNMKRRCLDVNNKKYHLYGGSGITITEEWLDFIPFMNWAMINGYSDRLTIDRIDNSKGYFPNNCRFVDVSTQNANKRISKKNKSGFIGVFRDKDGRYSASVQWRKRQIHIGRFNKPSEAAKARDNYIIVNNLPHTLNYKQKLKELGEQE